MLTQQIMTLRTFTVLLSIALLAACGGKPAIKPTAKPPSTSTASKQAPDEKTASKPVSKPVSKPSTGGYYLDDGPDENTPANIDSIPAATLKTEQPSKRANKPYSALGQQYTPMTSYAPYKKQGVASWYGKRYHGKKTSTGEIYDMYAMSAAHTILPIPSYAKVTNPANGRSVIVRVNDRGPFKNDRLIDLSYAAAYQLRLIKQGSGLVEVETIDTSTEALQAMSNNKAAQTSSLQVNSAQENSPVQGETTPVVTVATPIPAAPVVNSTPAPVVISATSTDSISATYYVQVGAFKNEVNGNLLQKKIQGLDLIENVGVANVYNNGLYRVKLGPYASKKEADSSAAKIRSQLNIATLVTNQ
jgi:rare lipoprotein A